MGYSTQPSESVLKKRLPANNRSIRELSLKEGILEATLQWWCQKAREQANDWQGDTARQVHTTLKSASEVDNWSASCSAKTRPWLKQRHCWC